MGFTSSFLDMIFVLDYGVVRLFLRENEHGSHIYGLASCKPDSQDEGIERAPVCSQFSHRTEAGDADEAERP